MVVQTIIAIIPARGGSKGIPGKNIRTIGGKPLLAWSIEQARQTPHISRVFVSTDSAEISDVTRENRRAVSALAAIGHMRPHPFMWGLGTRTE